MYYVLLIQPLIGILAGFGCVRQIPVDGEPNVGRCVRIGDNNSLFRYSIRVLLIFIHIRRVSWLRIRFHINHNPYQLKNTGYHAHFRRFVVHIEDVNLQLCVGGM